MGRLNQPPIRIIGGLASPFDTDNPRSSLTFNRTPFETPQDEGGVTNATINVSGVGMVSSIGDEAVTGTGRAVVTGNEMTGSIGVQTVTGTAQAVVTGNSMAAAVGDETVTGTARVTVTGNTLTAIQGNVTIADATIVSNETRGQMRTSRYYYKQARVEVKPCCAMLIDVGKCQVKIDYTAKMRKQEEEVMELLLAANW